MDNKYLSEIKARCEKATPEPWEYSDCAREIWNVNGVEIIGGTEGNGIAISKENADFIVHSRTDVEALLAEVERLTQARNYLQELYDKLYERHKNALKKQISKKIVSPEKNYSGLPIVQCPTCDNRDIEYGDCFCKRCGQKLNWNMDNFNK